MPSLGFHRLILEKLRLRLELTVAFGKGIFVKMAKGDLTCQISTFCLGGASIEFPLALLHARLGTWILRGRVGMVGPGQSSVLLLFDLRLLT